MTRRGLLAPVHIRATGPRLSRLAVLGLLATGLSCSSPARPERPRPVPLTVVPTLPPEKRLWDETPGERWIAAYFAGPLEKCRGGDAATCRYLSQRLFLVSNSRERALFAVGLVAACNRDVAAACGGVGRLLLGDMGLTADVGQGLALLERGCAGGDDISCSELGAVYLLGEHGQAGRRGEGLVLLRDSCAKLGGWPCWALAMQTVADGGSAGAPAAVDHACDTGDAHACFRAGYGYASGEHGYPRDAARAVDRYRRACEADQTHACYNLAWQYRRGEGVARNPARERELVLHACRLGDPVACDDVAATDAKTDPSVWQVYCDLWGARSCYAANSQLTAAQGEVAENAQQLLANGVRACNRGSEGACEVLDVLVKDKLRECQNSGPARDHCTFAGLIYEFGLAPKGYLWWGELSNEEGARQSYARACDVGSAVACKRMKRLL